MTGLRLPPLLCGLLLALCSCRPQTSTDVTEPPTLVDERVACSVLFGGDTSFGENYQARLAAKGGTDILQEHGYDYSLQRLTPLLRACDHTVLNLETPVTNLTASPLAGRKTYVHHADVEKTPAALARHGVTAVSLANNHAMDYGADGLQQTRRILQVRGVATCGAGMDDARAAAPWSRTLAVGDHQVRLVVAAGFACGQAYADKFDCCAGAGKPGVNRWTPARAGEQIRALRHEHPQAFIVAFPHWGPNYAWATARQRTLARALVAGGADLVLGHGAHRLQECEQIDGRWVVYGLGNFMFNSPGRYDKLDAPPYSLAARLCLAPAADGTDFSLRLYPIYSDNRRTGYRPRFVTLEEFSRVRRLLAERSHPSQPPLPAVRDDVGRCLLLDVTP